MRIMGGWIALTPELSAKLVLGRHVWQCAQHADAWGKRLPELREPVHTSEPANERVVRFMDVLEGREGHSETLERLTGIYRVLKPHLASLYARHLESANAVYEPPTRRILERCLEDERRHVSAGAVVLRHLATGTAAASRVADWERRLWDLLGEAGGISGDADVPMPAPIDLSGARPEQDVVILDSELDPARLEPALAVRLEQHAKAVAAGDWARVEAEVAPEARGQITGQYAGVPTPCRGFDIVALAKIGALRVARIRFTGPAGAAVVQLHCCPVGDDWRVAGAEVIRTEPAP